MVCKASIIVGSRLVITRLQFTKPARSLDPITVASPENENTLRIPGNVCLYLYLWLYLYLYSYFLYHIYYIYSLPPVKRYLYKRNYPLSGYPSVRRNFIIRNWALKCLVTSRKRLRFSEGKVSLIATRSVLARFYKFSVGSKNS
jgi:hypothetical protein